MKLLFVITFFLCISVGYGLKCYKCLTTKGWDDCKDIKTEMDCPAGYDRCFKGSAHVKDEGASVEEYGKGCMTKEACDTDLSTIGFCKGKGKCNLDCCSGDLCNVATLQKVSATALIACTLMALLY
nr:prostate stem cell antigen-like [Pocillopora verrucosa]